MRIRIVSALLIVTAFAAVAVAQTQTTRQYAAKFICGKASDEQVKAFLAAPGIYYTAINVHNPRLKFTITYQKKFALGQRSEQAGKISEWFRGRLKADETMQIDCVDIYRHIGVDPGTFIEGFAVIQPSLDLDVVGVYTAEAGNGVSAMHMERVPLRRTQP
jgi:hypothetical protein